MAQFLTLVKNMNTNDYFAVASLLVLISLSCIVLVAWCSCPRISSKGEDVLTYMMEAVAPEGNKKKKKIKKKKTSDENGSSQGDEPLVGSAEDKRKKKSTKQRAVQDIEKGTSSATTDGRRQLSTGIVEEVDFTHSHLEDSEHRKGSHSIFSAAFSAPEADVHSSAKSNGSVSTVSGAYEENLKKSLKSLLRGGMTMAHYRAGKPPKNILLSLVGTVGGILRWRSPRFLARNSYDLNLVDVVSIEWGKNTQVFLACKEAEAVPHDVCFSLVSESKGQFSTLDLQASSKVERDLLVQGFTLLIGDLKQGLADDQL